MELYNLDPFIVVHLYLERIKDLYMAYKWGIQTTYKSWDDPPRRNLQVNKVKKNPGLRAGAT